MSRQEEVEERPREGNLKRRWGRLGSCAATLLILTLLRTPSCIWIRTNVVIGRARCRSVAPLTGRKDEVVPSRWPPHVLTVYLLLATVQYCTGIQPPPSPPHTTLPPLGEDNNHRPTHIASLLFPRLPFPVAHPPFHQLQSFQASLLRLDPYTLQAAPSVIFLLHLHDDTVVSMAPDRQATAYPQSPALKRTSTMTTTTSSTATSPLKGSQYWDNLM